MIRACVMGFPVAHSLSPKLHGFWLKTHGIAGEYLIRETKPDNLQNALKHLADTGYAGCNLTLPLKEAAIGLMDTLDPSAEIAGAVNTVTIENGRLTGYNSDGFGFVESLKAQSPNYSPARTVIIGTGGAARGIVATLAQQGRAHFTLVNRTTSRAETLARDLNLMSADITGWEDRNRALTDATLVINCTNLGMHEQDALDISLDHLPLTATVADIVYRPLVTPFLQQAQARGHIIAEGLPMLLHQGRLGFRLWFGTDPAVTPDLYTYIAKEMS